MSFYISYTLPGNVRASSEDERAERKVTSLVVSFRQVALKTSEGKEPVYKGLLSLTPKEEGIPPTYAASPDKVRVEVLEGGVQMFDRYDHPLGVQSTRTLTLPFAFAEFQQILLDSQKEGTIPDFSPAGQTALRARLSGNKPCL